MVSTYLPRLKWRAVDVIYLNFNKDFNSIFHNIFIS